MPNHIHGMIHIEPDAGAPRRSAPTVEGLMPESLDLNSASLVHVSSALAALLESRSDRPVAPTPPSAPAEAQKGAGASRYERGGEIARGGMGLVERAFDRVLLRTVAMKTMLAPAQGPEADHFVEEAQITGQLDHPNIVPVYELGTTAPDDRAFFTMKLVSGQTLGALIRELHADGFPSEGLERLVAALVKVCEAVAFAHSRGVIHRDLKPANIMIGTHGQVYVMDWGLGLLRSGASTAAAAAVQTTHAPSLPERGVAGTVSYMAPEQASGRLDLVDERTDVFGLGAILYEVITSRPPYEGLSFETCLAAACEAEVTPPQDFCQHPIPPSLCEIALRAMQLDPEKRHASADAFGADLAAFLRGGGWFATLRVADGEIVVRQGDPAEAAYVIVEGQCSVFREREGRRTVLRTLGPGDAFGETALLSARPRTASVVAIGNVTLKLITAEAFERELGRSTWLAALVEQLAARFVELDQARSAEDDRV
jgi:eukaryotic-like serine/threonine-protein kinase